MLRKCRTQLWAAWADNSATPPHTEPEMTRLTCTDADTRRAYSSLMNAQSAALAFEQTGNRETLAHVLTNYQRSAANAISVCRKYPMSRTGHRPTVSATAF